MQKQHDAEHRESLSITLRTIRAETLRQANDINKLTERNAGTHHRLASAEQAAQAARTQLKTAELAIRTLKDEMSRARTMVSQTRASCANEVRRRDRQIDGLKKQLGDAGRTRGAGRSSNIMTINVTGDFGREEKANFSTPSAIGQDYDVKAETNEVMTELAKNLSMENDTLLSIIRRTLKSLRRMGGLQKEIELGQGESYGVQYQSNCEELSAELDAVLEHLRAILSNPCFVPIEEVEVREEEIHRLRDGWEKMETRWKEAVHLIDGWRRRMLSNGKGVNVEELKMGLRLSPVRVTDIIETAQGLGVKPLTVVREEDEVECEEEPAPESPRPRESLDLIPAPGNEDDFQDDIDSDASSVFNDHVKLEDLEVDEPNVEVLEQSVAIINDVPRRHHALVECGSAANRGPVHTNRSRPRQDKFNTIAEENTLELQEASMPPLSGPDPREESPQKKPRPPPPPAPKHARPPSPPVSNSSNSSTEQAKTKESQARPRLPRPAPNTTKPAMERVSRTRIAATVPSGEARARCRTKSRPRIVEAPESPVEAESVSSSNLQPQSRGDSHTHNEYNTITTACSTTPDMDESQPARWQQDSVSTIPAPQILSANGSGSNPNMNPRTPNPDRQDSDQSPVRRAASRLPLPANAPVQPSPQLTMASIAAKLAASERDADAARVRAKLKAVRGGNRAVARGVKVIESGGGSPSGERDKHSVGRVSSDEEAASAGEAGLGGVEEAEQVMKVEKVRKRGVRANKVANRRRSTLTPLEMRSLITGTLAVPASPSK